MSSPSTHVFYLLYFCFCTCMPLRTPVAQASVYVLVHYAKHHMDKCVCVCWALGACTCTLYVYFASGTPFLYRLFRVQASTGVCICTCALRHTPHGHMRICLLCSMCVCMYSVRVLRLRNTFPVSCICLHYYYGSGTGWMSTLICYHIIIYERNYRLTR